MQTSPTPLPLSDGAHCLITGGAGVLARVLAVRLAQRHRARIALVGRSVAGAAVAATIAAVEAAGGKAAYWQADAAEIEQLIVALAAAEARFGTLAAVFHLAGVPGQGIVSEKRWDDMRVVMRAKAGGLAALDAAIGDRPLKLFVAFASLASELGDFGQCDYAAANAFADQVLVVADGCPELDASLHVDLGCPGLVRNAAAEHSAARPGAGSGSGSGSEPERAGPEWR